MKMSDNLKEIIEEIYLEYKIEFKKYRKEITHFTRNGVYHEWKKINYEDKDR